MKKITGFSRLLFLGVPALLIMYSQAYAGSDEIGEISFILGEVTIISADSIAEKTAEINTCIRTGDKILTAEESRCEIKMKDDSVIRLGENSEFDVNEVTVKEKTLGGKAQLKRGSLWNNLIKLKTGDKSIKVKTPTSVMAVRGTVFRVDSQGDSSTSVLVYEGAVDVHLSEEVKRVVQQTQTRKSGPPSRVDGPSKVPGPYEVTLDQWKKIVAGMQIDVRNDGKYHHFEFDKAADSQNDWVRWNQERDRQLNR